MSPRTVGVVALGLVLGVACSKSSDSPTGPGGGTSGGAPGTDGGSGAGGAGTGGTGASGGTSGSAGASGGAGGSAGASGGSGGSSGGAGGSAGASGGAGGSSGGTGGTGGTGGSSGGSGGTGGTGGTGGGTGGTGGGTGGTGGSTGTCGDGVIQFGEQCEGSDFGGRTCQTLGFTSGSLACANCQIDASGCTGQENCSDGIDNDGDHLVDCADPDCAAACANPCANAVPLTDPADVSGDTTGHSGVGSPSCARAGSSAPAVVYTLTAANTGVLDVLLTSSKNLLVSVRTSCTDPTSEAFCGGTTQASTPVQQGDTLFVEVAGYNTTDVGPYQLSVRSRVPVCGDGVRDSGEECDDGNTTSGDGCSSTCTIESDETEPNDTAQQANAYVDPFHAQISPAGDADVVKVVVPTAGAKIVADTFDYGDGACYKQLLDSYIDIIGTDGTTVLASDDDSGSGLCAHAVASNLAAGTYYVKVTASAFGYTPTFPYVLHIAIQ